MLDNPGLKVERGTRPFILLASSLFLSFPIFDSPWKLKWIFLKYTETETEKKYKTKIKTKL